MDRISYLYDELLLKILSLLPAKDVVVTMLLSKRWKFLWMFVPKLLYDDRYGNIEYGKFSRLVDRSLFLHEAEVIETLQFKLGHNCGTGDIRVWIKAADKRCVRELITEVIKTSTYSDKTPVTLPKSLYTCCRTLVTLKLSNAVLEEDDVGSSISFPFLKKLSLICMKYPGEKFVSRLLSSCPVLSDLFVEQTSNDNVAIFPVKVPSLKSLVLRKFISAFEKDALGFVIDAPSLEFLDVDDFSYGLCTIEKNMTKIVEANIVANHWEPWKKFMGYATSAKRFYLCLATAKDAYPVGCVFHHLVYLKICRCEPEWLKILMRILTDSPNLRALKFQPCHTFRHKEPRPCWIEPISVPECVLTSLQTFERVEYKGAVEEKEAMVYILGRAKCLKKATIITSKSIGTIKKLELLKELSLPSRSSPACELVFL